MENQGTIRPGVKKYKDGGYTFGDGKANVGKLKRHIDHASKASKSAQVMMGLFIALAVIAYIMALFMLNSRHGEITPPFAYIGTGCLFVALGYYFVYRYFAMKHEQYLWEEYQWYISIKVMSGQPLKKGELIVSAPVTLYLNEEIAKNEAEKE